MLRLVFLFLLLAITTSRATLGEHSEDEGRQEEASRGLTCANVRCANGAFCEMVAGSPRCIIPFVPIKLTSSTTTTTTTTTTTRAPARRCPRNCPQVFQPVCATDGLTYSNECLMKAAACKLAKRVQVAHQGACESSAAGPTSRPACQTICTQIYQPVCGTDDKTYNNACELRKAACLNGVEVEVAHEGKCQQVDICQINCLAVYEPVCGTDGRTYGNECLLRSTGCRERQELQVARRGPCEQSTATSTTATVTTTTDRPCPEFCPEVYQPVCGSDNKTYSNKCFLEIAACKEKDIQVVHEGPCEPRKDCPSSAVTVE